MQFGDLIRQGAVQAIAQRNDFNGLGFDFGFRRVQRVGQPGGFIAQGLQILRQHQQRLIGRQPGGPGRRVQRIDDGLRIGGRPRGLRRLKIRTQLRLRRRGGV